MYPNTDLFVKASNDYRREQLTKSFPGQRSHSTLSARVWTKLHRTHHPNRAGQQTPASLSR
jgi:hypothetical protein